MYTLTAHDLAVLDHICGPKTDEERAAAVATHRRYLRLAVSERDEFLRRAVWCERSIELRRAALVRLGEDPDGI